MIDLPLLEHHIQQSIVEVLLHQRYARFRDLRPQGVDTNLFSYHLKLLQKIAYIVKTDRGYTLTDKGLVYADRVSIGKRRLRIQPKIITMVAVYNRDGDIMLQQRAKQPYIDTWTLPYGKLHIEDHSIYDAAKREVSEKLQIAPTDLRHRGDCYIRVALSDVAQIVTFAHIFTAQYDGALPFESTMWVAPDALDDISLAPAIGMLVRRLGAASADDRLLFEEMDYCWSDAPTATKGMALSV